MATKQATAKTATVKKVPAAKAKPAPAAKAKPAKRNGNGALDPAAKFYWVQGQVNPFKAGSGRHQRYEVLRTKCHGQTVEEIKRRDDLRPGTLGHALALGLGRVS